MGKLLKQYYHIMKKIVINILFILERNNDKMPNNLKKLFNLLIIKGNRRIFDFFIYIEC